MTTLALQVHPSSSILFKAPVFPSGFYFLELCSERGILPLDNFTENQGDAPISGLHFPTPSRLSLQWKPRNVQNLVTWQCSVCQAESLPQTGHFTPPFLEKWLWSLILTVTLMGFRVTVNTDLWVCLWDIIQIKLAQKDYTKYGWYRDRLSSLDEYKGGGVERQHSSLSVSCLQTQCAHPPPAPACMCFLPSGLDPLDLQVTQTLPSLSCAYHTKRNVSKAEAVLQGSGRVQTPEWGAPWLTISAHIFTNPEESSTFQSGTNTVKPVTHRSPFWPSHTATRVRRACGHMWFLPFFDCEFETFVPFISMTKSTNIPKNLHITFTKLQYFWRKPIVLNSMSPVTTVSQAN